MYTLAGVYGKVGNSKISSSWMGEQVTSFRSIMHETPVFINQHELLFRTIISHWMPSTELGHMTNLSANAVNWWLHYYKQSRKFLEIVPKKAAQYKCPRYQVLCYNNQQCFKWMHDGELYSSFIVIKKFYIRCLKEHMIRSLRVWVSCVMSRSFVRVSQSPV